MGLQNDEARMTSDELNPNDEGRMGIARVQHVAIGICADHTKAR
jgi:hypothetical protein